MGLVFGIIECQFCSSIVYNSGNSDALLNVNEKNWQMFKKKAALKLGDTHSSILMSQFQEMYNI